MTLKSVHALFCALQERNMCMGVGATAMKERKQCLALTHAV